MADTNISYRIEKARILAADTKTYGDFRAWLVVTMQEAMRQGRKFLTFRQRNVAKEFGVDRTTIVRWCRKAYAEGLLKARVRRIQLADGTWRRITNEYVVALAVKLRQVFRKAWSQLMNGGAGAPPEPPKPQKSAVSPYVAFVHPHHSAKSDHVPVPPERRTGHEHETIVRSFWSCRGCSTRNAWPARMCRQCRAEKPSYAERCFE